MVNHSVELDGDVGVGREVEMYTAVVRAKVSDPTGNTGGELARGRSGDDADRTAFGVAAEQRPLRSPQHFDALDVQERHIETLLTAKVNAVEIDADALVAGGLVGIERHDAANA